jgi:hypothetical protein
MTHQIGEAAAPGYIDKRRTFKDEFESRIVTGPVLFTGNATGTTTTIVGANATPSTNTNVIRIGDEFKLFTAAGALKQETVFRVTGVAVAGSTTVTFTPAASTAPVSTDTCRLVRTDDLASTANMDRRLVALGFTAARVATMTENDKVFQLRVSDDAGSLP